MNELIISSVYNISLSYIESIVAPTHSEAFTLQCGVHGTCTEFRDKTAHSSVTVVAILINERQTFDLNINSAM